MVNTTISYGSLKTFQNFEVLELPNKISSYQILLGTPWIREMRGYISLENEQMKFKQGNS